MARARRPLNRERVLQTAVRLADEGGIDSLSMRKLARELGVEAMSLYNHVASKADLVDAIVDLVVEEIELPSGEEDWKVAVRRCAVSAHDAFLRHPWACSLMIGPTETRTLRMPRLRYMDWLLGRLGEAGFSPEVTYHAYHALAGHMVGFTLWELGHMAGAEEMLAGKTFDDFVAGLLPKLREDGYPYIAEHAEQHLDPPSGQTGFEFGLDLILESLERARE